VLGILKKANAPKNLEIKIVGESLFNDGVGVVLFLTLFQIASAGDAAIEPIAILELFGKEVIGGVLLGLILGWLTYRLLRSIDDFSTEVIITLAAVMMGTVVAQKLHVSAPLAMVMAGLMIGHDRVRDAAMSETTELYLDKFWELIDILLNAVLFVLIGMEMLVLTYELDYVLAGLIAVPIVLICRYASLWLPVQFFEKRLDFVPYTSSIMTWGGLRGGISIALALSLSADMNRDLFLVMTYVIVVFSILVQGLTIEKVIKRLLP
jgi:CPA1 family monovalent cation:H+ antiporter